ncbi:MAG: TlpA disulfide reductase family protein [Actinomycetota bacterium]|nr:TlpA disulfide reductase family protein [Actinomycetota bacterium]
MKAAIALVLGAAAVALVVQPSLVDNASGSGGAPQLTTFGGGPAPAFSLPDLTYPTRTLSLSQFRGRPVLVNFWASWCVQCRKEAPLLEATYRRVGDRVAFLGVDTNDTRAAALSFLRQFGVTYPSVYDPHGTAATTYGLFGLPTTIFVAPDGKMLERHVGALSADALTAGIARLMRTASKPTAHRP